MTGSTRNKLLLFVIAILLLANIALIYFLVRGNHNKPSRTERHGMAEQLKKEVGFSEEQLKQYQQRRDAHMKEMRKLFEDLRITKENYFNTLTNTAPGDSGSLVTANEIGEKQKRVDLTTYQYFSGIRKICTPEQLPKYDSLYKQVIKRMISGRRLPSSKGKEAERRK